MKEQHTASTTEETLDPENWDAYRALAHQMVDDMVDFLQGLDKQPVWQKPTQEMKAILKQDLPEQGTSLNDLYKEYCSCILPFYKGNIHPRFFSWVEGNGTFTGALADFLASVMNSNLAIGDHGAVYVEHQVLDWCKDIVGFPKNSTGVLVSGGSVANVTALIVARHAFTNGTVKHQGLKNMQGQLVVYCSSETHNCIYKAVEALGIGADYLRKIPVTESYQIDLDKLRDQIALDREEGLLPFCIVGNAGTVNTGAIDPLMELSGICQKEGMWFHVDGAIGAVAHLLPEWHLRLKGIEEADSVAFDLHKWLYINYEAGCVLIRDVQAHRNAFAQPALYLSQHERGLAAGPDSFSNYGFELSRGFKSLKIWLNIREQGIDKYRRLIRQNIQQAFYTGKRIDEIPELELLTPVTLNIVCFRYNPGGIEKEDLNELNKNILMQLQEEGIAAPSYTFLHGSYALRMSLTNHRTRIKDLETVLRHVVRLGKELNGRK